MIVLPVEKRAWPQARLHRVTMSLRVATMLVADVDGGDR
jgi:hypothetical protein